MDWLETKVPPVVWFLAGAAIAWGITAADLDPSAIDNPAVAVIGVVVAVVGIGFGVAGVTRFGQARTTVNPHSIDRASALVTGGPYRYTCNPMYLGLALVLAGWSLVLGSIVALVVSCGLFLLVMTRLQIRPEERLLEQKFPTDFDDYRRHVRRWI